MTSSNREATLRFDRVKFLDLPRLVAIESLSLLNKKPLEEYIQSIDQEVAEKGKVSKLEAGYVGFTPVLPLFWDYRCAECRKFQEGSEEEPSTCQWVRGRIASDGYCTLWTPKTPVEKPFSWVTRANKGPAIFVQSTKNILLDPLTNKGGGS